MSATKHLNRAATLKVTNKRRLSVVRRDEEREYDLTDLTPSSEARIKRLLDLGEWETDRSHLMRYERGTFVDKRLEYYWFKDEPEIEGELCRPIIPAYLRYL